MTRLDQNTFIVELGKLFDKHQTAGSVYISMTSVDPAKTLPKGQTPSSTEPLCVVRATDGASGQKKIKISTLIAAKDVPQFNKTLSVVIKSHADALKKKEKKRKTGHKAKE